MSSKVGYAVEKRHPIESFDSIAVPVVQQDESDRRVSQRASPPWP